MDDCGYVARPFFKHSCTTSACSAAAARPSVYAAYDRSFYFNERSVHFNGPFTLTRLYWQVSYATRIISVDEYDAAVMREPENCPLIAAGDLRSGRQARPVSCCIVYMISF